MWLLSWTATLKNWPLAVCVCTHASDGEAPSGQHRGLPLARARALEATTWPFPTPTVLRTCTDVPASTPKRLSDN
eukprot:15449247-Alexandrium_andersonii.AAC.1